MRVVKNLDELDLIENEKFGDVLALDLYLIRKKFNIINGVIFVIGASCKESLELIFMHDDDYSLLKDSEIEYLVTLN